jgi:inner membrane protein
VENVCHTLVGGALARAGFDRLGPLATPTMLVASNLPDVDVVSMWWGDLGYLEYHRGITHSVLGLAVSAPVLAAAMLAWDRFVRRRRNPGAPPARFWALAAVALAGLASHTILDFTNSYGVKPWLPFDATWYYGDLVFIVDPWMWLLLGGALFVGARRGWRSNAFWGVVLTAMGVAVALSATAVPRESAGRGAIALWYALLGAIVVARVVWARADRAILARAGLASVIVYWCVLGLAHRAALTELEASRAGDDAPASVAAMPTLMRPDRWRSVTMTRESIRVADASLWRPERVDVLRVARNLDDPAVRAAAQTCPGHVATEFNRCLYADVEHRDDGRLLVRLGDARFSTVPRGYSFATTSVALEPDLAPAPDPRPCPRGISPW